jgi:hypothetical protein
MAAVNDVDVSGLAATSDESVIRTAISAQFWQWYHKHKDVVVLTVGWWIIRREVCVSDMHALFILLFGEET